jgi:excisionase family DNA binding protein
VAALTRIMHMRRIIPRDLTTLETAYVMRVSHQTVMRLHAEGSLRGYRVPGSTHRRFTREAIIDCMRAHGMPLRSIDEELAALQQSKNERPRRRDRPSS